jgi:ribosome-associated protein
MDEGISKTRRKAQMHALQAVGEALLALPRERLSWLDLPRPLAVALEEARRLSGHYEAYRRQMQYVGRLLQPYALAPLTELVAALRPGGAIDQARQREAERLAAALLDDESCIGMLRERFPAIPAQEWRQERRRVSKVAPEALSQSPEWRRLVARIRAALDAASPLPLPRCNDEETEEEHEHVS